MLESKKS